MAKLAFLTGMIALTLTVQAVGQLPPSSYKYSGTFPNPDATYFIETSIPGQCAALQDAGTGNGIPVVQRRCRNAPEFRFKFEPWIKGVYYFGGEFKIRTANGKCLHVQDGPPEATPPLPGERSWRKGLLQADCQDRQPFMFKFRDAGTSAEALGYKRIETMYGTCYHVREHPPGGNELWTWRCSPEPRNEPAFWFRFTTSPPAGRPIPPPRVKVFGDWPQTPFFWELYT